LYEKSSGWTERGKNGGVQLLDLTRMRASDDYNAALDYFGRGKSAKRIGYLGDQTLYTHMEAMWPALFYQLGCEWNRQLSPQFGYANATVHRCERQCAILHANAKQLKCVAATMQKHLASCKVWHGFINSLTCGLERPADATILLDCPHYRSHDQGLFCGISPHSFSSAMKMYFWDCCVTEPM